MHPALVKILQKPGVQTLFELIKDLKMTELNSLLLFLFQQKMQAQKPHELLQKFRQNRFVQASDVDPIVLKQAEIQLLNLALSQGFRTLELSPAAPLGTSSVYGRVHQNNVLSALRNTEFVSDPSNMLALHLTERWLKSGRPSILRACTSQRCIRTAYAKGPHLKSHFQLFACTSLVDTQDPVELTKELMQHIQLYEKIYQGFGLTQHRLRLIPYPGSVVLFKQVKTALEHGLRQKLKVEDVKENTYYHSVRVLTDTVLEGDWLNLADCGMVTWPAALTGQKSIRLIISGLGVERLISV